MSLRLESMVDEGRPGAIVTMFGFGVITQKPIELIGYFFEVGVMCISVLLVKSH